MESSSRFCEVSTYTQSSGYNSSTASSSLNYIDEDHLSSLIDTKQIENNHASSDRAPITKLIITITLLRIDEEDEKVKFVLRICRLSCVNSPRGMMKID